MASDPVNIKRYPNRRYYASSTSKYVSLGDIEAMVKSGQTVEIRDSQSGEDMTQVVLTQIIMEQHPEKMSLFPADMLHLMLRSNDAMSSLLGDYFRHSLDYLKFLKVSNPTAATLAPMQWFHAWLSNSQKSPAPQLSTRGTSSQTANPPASDAGAESNSSDLATRLKQLEERLSQLESGDR